MKDQESKKANRNFKDQGNEDQQSNIIKQLQKINDRLQEIQNEIKDLQSYSRSANHFISKAKPKIDHIIRREEENNDLLRLLVEYNEFKEGYIEFYNGVNGGTYKTKSGFGIPDEG